MEYNELIADFAQRHNVADLVSVDGAASLDIDGLIVTIVLNDETLVISAELGDPPAEGASAFSDLLLEANLQSGEYFAKAPGKGPYLVVRRLPLRLVDGPSFDTALEAFVNTAETWKRLLTDFRPVAKAAAEHAEDEHASLGSSGFMQV